MHAKPRPSIPLLSQESDANKNALVSHLRAALPGEHIDLLERLTPAQLDEVDVAIAANPAPAMFSKLPNLVWLQSMWAGVEGIINAAQSCRFKLVRLVDPKLAETMAEAALAWTLYLNRRMPEYAQQQRARVWQQLEHREPADCRVSVLGLGALGSASTQKLASNGFSVTGWSRSAKVAKEIEGINCCSGDAALENLLSTTDILILLLPLTPATENLLNKRNLPLLPKGASLINFARGAIVNSRDLLHELDHGELNHAVLDVFHEEPLPENSPFWINNSVTILPHIAAPTDPKSASEIAARNISEYRATGRIPKAVDLANGF